MSAILSIHDPGMLDLISSLLQQEKKVQIKVTGSSMQPFLQGGETLELTAVPASSLHRGDILLHLDPDNTPLVHRLIRFRYQNEELYLQTKGDNCAAFDAPVLPSRVLARVQAVLTCSYSNGNRAYLDLSRPFMRCRGYTIALGVLIKHYREHTRRLLL